MPTDDKKVLDVMNRVLKLLNKEKLSISELLVFYGNLGYHIGTSIMGCKGSGPTLEELKRAYYSRPTVDTGLAIQGMLITSWESDYLKHPELSTFAQDNLQKKENNKK